MKFGRKALEKYFGPWAFEKWQRGRVYELIGIRFWKVFLRTSSRPKSQWGNLADSDSRRAKLKHNLDQHIKFTYKYELRHLGGAFIMQASAPFIIAAQNGGSMTVVTILNLLINGYPIVLQRYNRVRVHAALKRIER